MSQYDILAYLENNKNLFFTAEELSKHFDQNSNSIRMNLLKLRRRGFVNFKLLQSYRKDYYVYSYKKLNDLIF